MARYPLIKNPINPYRDNVQGKANEPITVAGFLDRAHQISPQEGQKPDWTLEEIYNRLEANAPRIAIIGGSPDHPAHVMDYQTSARAALRIWQNGGVPFHFSTPVLCDGTAQSNMGMSYSLQSRNAVAQMIVNQLEAHSYHGAFVIQGCDKQPLGVVSGLAHLDRLRQRRGEAPFFATFAPAHVLQGGRIPDDLQQELREMAAEVEAVGEEDIANDIRDAMEYILQCTSNTAFQGVLQRAVDRRLITKEKQKDIEKRLAVNTCDPLGGICAFNGTGNSSRHIVAGMGLVHPSLELLTEPPEQEAINQSLDALTTMINDPVYSVSNIMATNIRNAIKVHSASGGSTNLMMHIVAAMLYGGYRFSLDELDRIHQEMTIPDLFDYSLTEGRDIYVLASQCCGGQSRGMETLFNELVNNGIPMDVDAPTVTGSTWRARLSYETASLAANNLKENKIILSDPKRPFSGVDVLKGNFMESAVVKISGMSTPQLDRFDEKTAIVLYFANEEEANKQLLQNDPLADVRHKVTRETLLASAKANHGSADTAWMSLSNEDLFDTLLNQDLLKFAVIIAGQGPHAYGMPEMFTPMQHINSHRKLRKLATLISDGRYSGATYGAAIGHVTPESFDRGGILYLQTGDLLYLGLRERLIQYVNPHDLESGEISSDFTPVIKERYELGESRLKLMKQRQRLIAASNRMAGHTDAYYGVIPETIMEEAELDYKSDVNWPLESTKKS